MQRIEIPEGADLTGKISVFLSASLYTLHKLKIEEINQWILLISAIVGLGYIIVKTFSAVIEYKIKRTELKKLQDEQK